MNEGLEPRAEQMSGPEWFRDRKSWGEFQRAVDRAYIRFCRERGMPLETFRDVVNAAGAAGKARRK